MAKSRRQGVCFEYARSGTCRFGETCKFSHVQQTNTDQAKKPSRKRSKRKERPQDHVDAFFASYPEFTYNRSAPIVAEFYRMCDFFGWEKDDEEKGIAREDFKNAMVHQFNSLYGTDVNDIESWQKLCLALDIVPLPQGIEQCRKTVQRTHVNLVDLVETQHTGTPVEVFGTLAELRAYTIEEAKYFPKESAYAGGVLKFLLREILHKRHP